MLAGCVTQVGDQAYNVGRIADRWHISRSECDEIAPRSQAVTAAAWDASRFADEVLALDLPGADEETQVSLAQPPVQTQGETAEAARSAPRFGRPDGLGECGEELEDVADDTVVADLEDVGVRVLVHRDDDLA